MATNQIHFYSMVTAIISADLTGEFPQDVLIAKLSRFGQIIDNKLPVPKALTKFVNTYIELSQRQTTHVSRRKERERIFLEIIRAL
jgi:hypothetical protein